MTTLLQRLRAPAAAAALISCGGTHSSRLTPPSQWNVLLISIDTLRADRLNCYGYRRSKVTPHIDALARDGILFESHIASSPWTTPSHMSLFTSLLPTAHGVTTPFTKLINTLESDGEVERLAHGTLTLAAALATAGRATAAFTGGYTLDPRIGFDQGFERYETSMHKLRPGNMQPVYDWVDEQKARPFFLFWHTFEVHAPYLRATYLDEVLSPDSARRLKQALARSSPAWARGQHLEGEERDLLQRLEVYSLPVCEALYAGGVQWVDHWVGELVRHLRDRGLYDRTLIVFTSDHGEQLGDGPARQAFYNAHGHTLYEEMLRIPLLVKLPYESHAGVRVSSVSRTIDVMPTILDVLGLAPSGGLAGVSLRPLWEGAPRPADMVAVSEALGRDREKKAARSDRYKYIVSMTEAEVERFGRAFIPERPGARELYDLATDPGETKNLLAGQPSQEATRQAAALDRALRQAIARRGFAEKTHLDRQTAEELKAFGYVH